MTATDVPVLLLSGPPGVGKSVTAWEIFDQVVSEGGHPALVDLDYLGACWPTPDDDPYHDRLKATNLAAVWQNLSAAGAQCLIAAGVIGNPEMAKLYSNAIPDASPTLCRLTAGERELYQRIGRRGRERGGGVERLHHHAIQVSQHLKRNDGAAFAVDTDARDVADVARLVRERAGGWPGEIAVSLG